MAETKEAIPRAYGVNVGNLLGSNPIAKSRAAEFTTPLHWRHADIYSAQRCAVADEFSASLAGLDGIDGIWVTDSIEDLQVAIVLDAGKPELEIEIRRVFIDLMCERLDPSTGELLVFDSDEVPDWLTDHRRLK